MSFKFVFIASRDVRNLAAFFTSKENNHGHNLA